jgi:hypothetical protein
VSPVQPERCWPPAAAGIVRWTGTVVQLLHLKSTATAQISLHGNSRATVDAPHVYREHSGMPGTDGKPRRPLAADPGTGRASRSPGGVAVTGRHSMAQTRKAPGDFGNRHRVLVTIVNARMRICIAWLDCSSTNRTRGGSGNGEQLSGKRAAVLTRPRLVRRRETVPSRRADRCQHRQFPDGMATPSSSTPADDAVTRLHRFSMNSLTRKG